MTSDDAKYMEEFGPRVVALLDRLQKAAGVGELRTRADLVNFATLPNLLLGLESHGRA